MRMNIVINRYSPAWITAIFLTLGLCGCEEPRLPEPSAEAPPEPVAVLETNQKDFEEFAYLAETAVNNGQTKFLSERYESEALLDYATEGARMDAAFEKDFRQNAREVLPGMFKIYEGSKAKYLKLETAPDSTKLLFRFIKANGDLTYTEFFVRLNNDNEVTIYDFYDYSLGERWNPFMRRLLFAMLPQEKRSLLSQQGGAEAGKIEDFRQVQEVFGSSAKDDVPNALSKLKGLPTELRSLKSVMLRKLSLTAESDKTLFSNTLELYRLKFPRDPSLALFLIDYHYGHGNYGQMRQAISQLRETVQDPYLYYYEILSYVAEKDFQSARKSAETYAKADPDSENMVLGYLKISLAEADFPQAAKFLTRLEKEHDYHLLSDVRSEESYRAFRESDAGRAWLLNSKRLGGGSK